MSLLERIVNDPGVCQGKSVIRGTRVLVSVIIDNLAAGVPEERILSNYPSLQEDVRAVVQYSAMLARGESFVNPPRADGLPVR